MESTNHLAQVEVNEKKPKSILEDSEFFKTEISTTEVTESTSYFEDSFTTMEVSSHDGNVISIPEDQIVKIEYQNENGVINTEYIVDEDILKACSLQTLGDSYIENPHESLYEEQVGETIIKRQTTVIFSRRQTLTFLGKVEETSNNCRCYFKKTSTFDHKCHF